MPLPHLLLALVVVAIWGSNFVVMKAGLETWPPLLFAALRFAFSALPLLLLPRPSVPMPYVALYGLLIGVGQFGLLFFALDADITPGIASIVIQMQVFFTIGLAALAHREPVRPWQAAGLTIALCGIGVIAWNVHDSGDGVVTISGLALVLAAAFNWGLGNIIVKRAGRIDVLPFMAWSSVWPALVLAAASVWIEGPERMRDAFEAAGSVAWSAAAWQAVGNTLFGYRMWSWLLARHPAATVSPMGLLVPVFGLGTAVVAGQDVLEMWKIAAAALVLTGLGVTVWAGRGR